MTENSLVFRVLLFYGHKMPYHRGKWWVHSQLRNFFRANVNVDLDVVHNGLRWMLNPSDYVEEEFFWLGTNDSWDLYHIKQILKPDNVIFDIGANFGFYSITLVAGLHKRCQVHAFEPNPSTYKRLVRNIKLNSLDNVIEAHCIGLGDIEGIGSIIEKPGNSGASWIHMNGNGERVLLITLDKFCKLHHINQLDFIKIDIEGFEEKCLRGATESISRFRPKILIELSSPTLTRAGSSVNSVVNILKQYGYQLFIPCRNKIMALEDLPSGHNYVNVFCFPEELTKVLLKHNEKFSLTAEIT